TWTLYCGDGAAACIIWADCLPPREHEVRLMSPEYSTALRESAEERSRRRLAEKPGAVVKQTMLPVTSHISLEFVGLVLNFFEAVFDKIEHVNDSAQQPIPCDRHALNLVFVH